MAYTGKIYIAYDALNDKALISKTKEFRQSDGSIFDFYDGSRFVKDLDKVIVGGIVINKPRVKKDKKADKFLTGLTDNKLDL